MRYTINNNITGFEIALANSNFVTPEEYGAVGDGVTDDKAAIQLAVNSGKLVRLNKKRYYISGSINLPEGTTIQGTGLGTTANIRISANEPAFKIQGHGITIDSVSFIGDGDGASYSPAKPNQHAIAIEGEVGLSIAYERLLVSNCTFYGLQGAGVYTKYNVGIAGYAGGVQVSNCVAYLCTWGYFCSTRGEYNMFVGCKAYKCAIGFRAAGGNNVFTGGILTSNITGVYLEAGANDGHAVITATAINHNSDYSVWANGITLGYIISNCTMYASDIYIQNSIGIRFSSCQFGVGNIYVQSSTRIRFIDNDYITSPNLFLSYNGTDNTGSRSDVFFSNNKFWETTPAAVNELDADVVTAIKAATYDTNKKASITPASSKVFYRGEKWFDETNNIYFEAIADNVVYILSGDVIVSPNNTLYRQISDNEGLQTLSEITIA